MTDIENSGLGKATRYDSDYDPGLLYPIPRAGNRATLRSGNQAFAGQDWWTCYELSWLESGGRPRVALAHFRIPADSECLIESKSFKLYLNSLNHLEITNEAALKALLVKDLSDAAGGPVVVELGDMTDGAFPVATASLASHCIDDIPCDDRHFVYQPDAGLLHCNIDRSVHQVIHSNLLRSNCPVTGQPDWASLFIEYRGPQIDEESLLRYIISYRNCQDFHEHCVEQIFCDLMAQCQCQSLSVYARYTRRGGLDINPYRATPDLGEQAPFVRTVRQ